MTELLYNIDAYMQTFSAKVLSCEEVKYDKKTAYAVILDSTCFFPEQGGQDSDLGILRCSNKSINVLHASISDNIITHICSEPIDPGMDVEGTIDWTHRFDFMQQHSGEHLVSGTVHKLFGYDNVGFHLSTREVTLDFNGTFEDDDILKVEEIVNRAIYNNITTHIFYPTKEELTNLNYRSKKDIQGDIRIVEYPGYDICACCAPHVKMTGEIGMIKIVQYEHFKGGTRIWIKCGSRARCYFEMLLNTSRRISRLNSVKIEDIYPSVEKMSNSLKDLRYNMIALERELLELKACEALKNKYPLVFMNSCDADSAREAVNIMASKNEMYSFVFIGNDESGYRFLMGSSKHDCRSMLADLKNEFAIKGGGSETLIQGNISATREAIENYFNRR